MRKAIKWVGLYQIGTHAYRLGRSYYDLKQENNNERLQELFGKGEWALITGASEGIGEEYAIQLAKSGFNLVLVSRTKENLEKVAEKAKLVNPNIQTEVYPADVSTITPDQVKNLFSQKRFSIVVNNAGKMNRGLFFDQNPHTIQAMIKTNIYPYVLMSKYATLNFLKHADQHDHKVGLIHTSSIASDLQMPWSSIYSGTKRFNEVFGDLISQQHKKSYYGKDLIVTQILKPCITTTRLANWKKGPAASTPQEVVQGSLADLGILKAVYGSFSHNIQGHLCPFFINGITKHFISKQQGREKEDPFDKM